MNTPVTTPLLRTKKELTCQPAPWNSPVTGPKMPRPSSSPRWLTSWPISTRLLDGGIWSLQAVQSTLFSAAAMPLVVVIA